MDAGRETDFFSQKTSVILRFMENNIVVLPTMADISGNQCTTHRSHKSTVLAQSSHPNLHIVKFDLVQIREPTEATPAVYVVDIKGGNQHGCDAYWCGYREDGNGLGMIGPNARYLFRPTMDGCSLFIGNASPDGRRLVIHSNAIDHGRQFSAIIHEAVEEVEKERSSLINKAFNKITGSGVAARPMTDQQINALTQQSTASKMQEMAGEVVKERGKEIQKVDGTLHPYEYKNADNEHATTYGLCGKKGWKIYTLKYKIVGSTYTHLGNFRRMNNQHFAVRPNEEEEG